MFKIFSSSIECLPSLYQTLGLGQFSLASFSCKGWDKFNAIVDMLHGTFIQIFERAAAHVPPVMVLPTIATWIKALHRKESWQAVS